MGTGRDFRSASWNGPIPGLGIWYIVFTSQNTVYIFLELNFK